MQQLLRIHRLGIVLDQQITITTGSTVHPVFEFGNQSIIRMRFRGTRLGQSQEGLTLVRRGVQRARIGLQQHGQFLRRTMTADCNVNRKPSLLVLLQRGRLSSCNHHTGQLWRDVIRKGDMKRSALADAAFLDKGIGVDLDQFMNQVFLRLRVHLGVALRNDMKWKRAVAILDGRCLGGPLQNGRNDLGTIACIRLAGNGLMEDGRRNVIVHNHGRRRDDWVLVDLQQEGVPIILAAKGKDGHHVVVGRRAAARTRHEFRHGHGSFVRSLSRGDKHLRYEAFLFCAPQCGPPRPICIHGRP